MEDCECFEHKRVFNIYCEQCNEAFCDMCPCHDESHLMIPLLYALSAEKLNKVVDCSSDVLAAVDCAVQKTSQRIAGLVDGYAAERSLALAEHQKAVAALNKEYEERVSRMEEEMRSRVRDLEECLDEYRLVKRKLEYKRNKISDITALAKTRFNGSFSKAFESIKEFRSLNIKEALDSAEKAIDQLNGRVKNVNVHCKSGVGERDELRSVEEVKEGYGEEAEGMNQIGGSGNIISDLRLAMQQNDMGNLGAREQHRDNAMQAGSFDEQMVIAENSLNELKEENAARMRKIVQYINLTKAQESLIDEVREKVKKDLTGRTHKMLVHKEAKIVSDAEIAEKSLVLQEIDKCAAEIHGTAEEIKGRVVEYKKEVGEAQGLMDGIKKEAANFQTGRLMTMFNFTALEDRLKELEGELEAKKAKLTMMQFEVTRTETDFENELTKKEVELDAVVKSIGELEEEIHGMLESSEVQLLVVKTALEKKLRGKAVIDSTCKACQDGKLGRVKLCCGHCMCVPCTAKQRIGGLETGESKVICGLCNGKKQDISTFHSNNRARGNGLRVHRISREGERSCFRLCKT